MDYKTENAKGSGTGGRGRNEMMGWTRNSITIVEKLWVL